MELMSRNDGVVKQFRQKNLILSVSKAVRRDRWDESRYEAFLDCLCEGGREYQKDAIFAALRYLLGGEYEDLCDLAKKNFEENEALKERHGDFQRMAKTLQLPHQLSASLDLATGTGKSYVLYAIAVIMLAEGVVDRVLVLAPSTTIESGLFEKFKDLAGRADLRGLLPKDAAVNAPRVIKADESIVPESICIENYHAILKHVKSSIRDSLVDKGAKTLVLNDEAHHVANESGTNSKRWKEFLTDPSFGFQRIIGVSGTCYVGQEYFSDVIYRYSLRQAIEQRFVKKIWYVDDGPRLSGDKKWKLILKKHEEIAKQLRDYRIKPLTIVVTKDITRCNNVAEEFKQFLKENTKLEAKQADDMVLTIHSKDKDLPKLATVDSSTSKVEWIFSVSMLNEGWDVKRVFQIVPHEERAFNSKLLISQVLGRGLRIPENWRGNQPEVLVFNHDKWAGKIRHLVDEIMEIEKCLPSFSISESKFNFSLCNINYHPNLDIKKHEMKKPYKLFKKGHVDLPTQKETEEIGIDLEEASTKEHREWKTSIKNKTYTIEEIVEVMMQRFKDVSDESDRQYYLEQFPKEKLTGIVRESLGKSNNEHITEGLRQKFLQSLGTLRRESALVARYDFVPQDYFEVDTSNRPRERVNASSLKSNKTIFYTEKTRETLPDEYIDFYDAVTEEGSGYKCIKVPNYHDFKTSLNAVIADHDNERRFIKKLLNRKNLDDVEAWVKSTAMNFYSIHYHWKKGEHPKKGSFNPDFFIKLKGVISVVEIKDDDEIREPSPENRKKKEYADRHFKEVNQHIESEAVKYKFNFLTPRDFDTYFQSVCDGSITDFRSQLDVKLDTSPID